MFAARLRCRVPSAQAIGAYRLMRHDLRFHKRSGKDDSAKCDAYATGDDDADDGSVVMGRLFRIAAGDAGKLDEAEGLGKGYERKTVCVMDDAGKVEDAFTYCATRIDTCLRPYTWYKEHVLAGAREANFPDDYIDKIAAVAADKDPDREREWREMALHDRWRRLCAGRFGARRTELSLIPRAHFGR